MEWSAQHPYLTTRNRTHEQEGKGDHTHNRFIIWTCQQKGLSGLNMGKSIKTECVIQILSHPQKYEQVLKFPTHILSAQSGSVTAHKWFDAAWGPGAGGGWGCWIIFSSLQWPWPADWAIPFSLGQSGSAKPTVRAFGPGNPCFFILCLLQFSVNTTAGNLVGGAASCLWLHTWSQILTPGHRTLTTWQSKRKLNLWSFMGLASWNMNINVCGTWGQDIAVWIFRKLLTLGLLGEKKDTFLVLKLKSILLLHKLICLIRCSLLSCLTFILLQSTKYLVEAVH